MDSCQDAVFDFDLNFLQLQPKDSVVKCGNDKQRKAISVAKKKIMATNTLIEKFYAKKEQLEDVERSLLLSKEECKNICIDYRNAMEKCAVLEHEVQILQSTNRCLQERIEQAETSQEGIQSHVRQLQILVKEYEAKFESHTSNTQQEKAKVKENERRRLCMQKENEGLIKNLSMIASVVLGKKKIDSKLRQVLKKYAKSADLENSDEDDTICDDNIFEEPISPLVTSNAKMPDTLNSSSTDNVIFSKIEGKSSFHHSDQDSDGTNEIVSEDTGRGSSLAYSDSDKCFNSPDYFASDSPPNNDILKNKELHQNGRSSPKHKTVDCASSPIFKHFETTQICHESVDQATSPMKILDKKQRGLTSPFEECRSTDQATSPHQFFQPRHQNLTTKVIETACIAIRSTLPEESSNCLASKKAEFSISGISPLPTPSDSKIAKQRKEILESSNLSDDIVSDTEIEMILSEMRLSHNFITPLPTTPSRSIDSTNVVQHECLDAKKVMEENKKINENVANLTKEINSIKNLLMHQQLLEKDTIIQSKLLQEKPHCSSSLIISNNNDTEVLGDTPVPKPIAIPTIQIISPLASPVRNTEMQDFDQGVETEDDIEFDISDSENNNDCSIRKKIVFSEPIKSRECSPDITSSENNNIVELHDFAKVPSRKLTRLEKLRKKMLPKSKIKPSATVSKNLSKRRLKLLSKTLEPPVVKKVSENDTAASLNDKTIYEKALKVMKELKTKSSNETDNKKIISRRKPNRNQSKSNIEATAPSRSVNTRSQSKISSQTSVNTSPVAKNISVTHKSKDSPKEALFVTADKTPRDNLDNDSSHIVLKKITSKRVSITLTDILEDVRYNEKSAPNSTSENKTNMRAVCDNKRRVKRPSVEIPEFSPKRMLRSSTTLETELAIDTAFAVDAAVTMKEVANKTTDVANKDMGNTISAEHNPPVVETVQNTKIERNSVDYSDLFTENTPNLESAVYEHRQKNSNVQSKNCYISYETGTSYSSNILCSMIEKHGKFTVNHARKNIPETIIDSTCQKIKETICNIIELPSAETNDAMDKFVEKVERMNWKHFILGLIKYLKDPERKNELYKKVNSPPAPPMTNYEQILLYVVIQMQANNPTFDAVDSILKNIEYTLFTLNRTPDFDAIESLSHFYAIICRYFKAKSRLRLFVIDAMYCIQFKSVTLIKQCLDVWMHVLPLAHMGIAKSTLVTCLVYLLHFYKCEDKFNKVQDIRTTLSRKYFYEMSEWNESKILEVFTTAIIELRDIPIEKKMLRMSLIILAKRNGARWCQNNVIKKILQPVIAKEGVPDRIKVFCVSMLGPLLKPFPANMKLHCEIVLNQLVEMLQKNPSSMMKEAIFSSLMCVSKHNPNCVLKALLSWNPRTVSADFEVQMRDFVREKNIKTWKNTLSNVAMEERNKELYSG